MSSKEELREAIRRIAKADSKDLSQCLQEVREDSNVNDCRLERIVVVLDSDAEREPVPKRPKLSNVRSTKPGPRETEPTNSSQEYHEPSTGCLNPSTSHLSKPEKSLTPAEHHNRSPTPPPKEPTVVRDGLIKHLAEIKQLTQTCPCELQSHNVGDDEDFRIRDIQSETTKLNAFRASLAYWSLAVEFHEYEVQQIKTQRDKILAPPRLNRLYAEDYSRQNSNKRLSRWTREKGFKQLEKTVRRHVEYGQRLCVISKRLSDGWGPKSCSFIPIMIHTFMARKIKLSHSLLEKNMSSVINDKQIYQANVQHQSWLDACFAVYHRRDSLPEAFKHTCGASHQSPRIDVSSAHLSALNDQRLAEESRTADRLTSPSTFDLMQCQPNATTNIFAEDSKFWCKWFRRDLTLVIANLYPAEETMSSVDLASHLTWNTQFEDGETMSSVNLASHLTWNTQFENDAAALMPEFVWASAK